MGTHLRVLSKCYLMNTNITRFRWLTKKSLRLLWLKASSVLEGLLEGLLELLVADLDIKVEKRMEPWHVGTHLITLSEGFPMNTKMTGFR